MKVKEQKIRLCAMIEAVGIRLGCAPQCTCHLSDDMDVFGDNIMPLEKLEEIVEQWLINMDSNS